MRNRSLSIIVVTLLMAGGVLVYVGEPDQQVSLSSIMQLWTDALNDADQIGLKLARVSDDREMAVGAKMASAMSTQWSEHRHWQPYVAAVGRELAPYLRRQGIRYQFHVIDTPQINATDGISDRKISLDIDAGTLFACICGIYMWEGIIESPGISLKGLNSLESIVAIGTSRVGRSM